MIVIKNKKPSVQEVCVSLQFVCFVHVFLCSVQENLPILGKFSVACKGVGQVRGRVRGLGVAWNRAPECVLIQSWLLCSWRIVCVCGVFFKINFTLIIVTD